MSRSIIRCGGSRGPKSDKVWADAIRRAVHRYRIEKNENGKSQKERYLNVLADNLVKLGLNGDVTAIKEIGDRLDGKAHQSIGGEGETGEILVKIVQ